MKKQIKLNSKIGIDREKLIQSRMVILANSGGGKSYAVRKFAEEAVEDTQTIIIDPEGEFASLREKFDFILAGKNADVPAEARSAGLLAIKLLELNKSAVIDLYELHPQERQRFVKNFFEAMINAPKELYHPVFIVLDEAHEYAPEGKPSEATNAVESMASRGRKRGFCLIPASQRISKLSKNVSAECNNKLIGRASQDIDMKRAGDELGFNKESLVKLRQLKPGEFFAFGPAISDEVIQLKVGEVKTAHAKVSYKGGLKIAPPSSVIKKALNELKNLPQEAEKEANTVTELKQQLTLAKRQITELERNPVIDSDTIDKAVKQALAHQAKVFDSERQRYAKEYKILMNLLTQFKTSIPETFPVFEIPLSQIAEKQTFKMEVGRTIPLKQTDFIKLKPVEIPVDGDLKLGKCAAAIYSYLANQQGRSLTKVQVAVATGYSVNSGGFNNSISELVSKGLIARGNALLSLSGPVQSELLIEIDPSLQKWSSKLGACARKIWDLMLDHHPDEVWEKTMIADNTGYSVTSGGFNNSISELNSLGLIERLPGAQLRINPEVLTL